MTEQIYRAYNKKPLIVFFSYKKRKRNAPTCICVSHIDNIRKVPSIVKQEDLFDNFNREQGVVILRSHGRIPKQLYHSSTFKLLEYKRIYAQETKKGLQSDCKPLFFFNGWETGI